MHFSKYCLLAIASLAFHAYALPTANHVRPLALPSGDDVTIMKRTPLPEAEAAAQIPAFEHVETAIGQRDNEERTPAAAPHISKDSVEAQARSLPEVSVSGVGYRSYEEPLQMERRAAPASGTPPNVGIKQDLPSGIIIFLIVFMFYAMITAISFKDSE